MMCHTGNTAISNQQVSAVSVKNTQKYLMCERISKPNVSL